MKMPQFVRRWLTVMDARWMSDTEYHPYTRFLSPASLVVFGKDDAFWARIERIAPHKVSTYDPDLTDHIGWVSRHGTGVWSLRGGLHRGLYETKAPSFRHVFYFAEPNDALAFRMRCDSRPGDVGRHGTDEDPA